MDDALQALHVDPYEGGLGCGGCLFKGTGACAPYREWIREYMRTEYEALEIPQFSSTNYPEPINWCSNYQYRR